MLEILTPIIFGAIASVLGFFIKSLYARLESLEGRSREAIDEMKVRQIIEDKLAILSIQTSDIKEDVREIKIKIDKLLDAKKEE